MYKHELGAISDSQAKKKEKSKWQRNARVKYLFGNRLQLTSLLFSPKQIRSKSHFRPTIDGFCQLFGVFSFEFPEKINFFLEPSHLAASDYL